MNPRNTAIKDLNTADILSSGAGGTMISTTIRKQNIPYR